MADVLPVNIPAIQSPAIASYSFTELLTQQGLLEIYPAEVYGSPDYILTTNSIYSAPNYYITLTDGQSIDIDFDITIGKSFDVLSGTAYLNVPLGLTANGTHTLGETITFYIRHWNGSTETQIASATLTIDFTVGLGTTSQMLAAKMTTTGIHFKVGDVLRVSYVSTAGDPAGTTSRLYGIDPADRIDTSAFAYGARSTFYIPVKLNS